MKILFLEPCFENFGGYFRAINICTSLSKNNEVLLICPAKKSFFIKTIKINNHLKVIELPHFRYNQIFNGRLLRMILSIFFIVFSKSDIVHAAVAVQPETFLPALFARLIGKKVVLDWDDLWQVSSSIKPKSFFHSYVTYVENISPKLINNIVTVSTKLSEIAKSLGAKNILVLINAVNTKQFSLPTVIWKEKKYIAYFGNTISKGRFVKTMAFCKELYKYDKSLKLITNMDLLEISKNFKEVVPGIEKYYKKTPKLKPEEMGDYLAQCKGALFIGEENLEEQTCFPIRIGSNIAANLPIYTVENYSEYTSIIKNNKCGIVAKNTKQLAKLVFEVTSKENSYNQLESQTIKAKQVLSWDNQISKLEKFYTKIKQE